MEHQKSKAVSKEKRRIAWAVMVGMVFGTIAGVLLMRISGSDDSPEKRNASPLQTGEGFCYILCEWKRYAVLL